MNATQQAALTMLRMDKPEHVVRNLQGPPYRTILRCSCKWSATIIHRNGQARAAKAYAAEVKHLKGSDQ
jgi:hypothetical protein